MIAVSSSRAMRTDADFEADAGVVVLLLQPTSAEANLQPALRKHVESRELLRQYRGLSEVLGEHGLCHPQRGGRVRDRLSRDERRERSHEVVSETEGRVAECFDGARRLEQLDPLRRNDRR